MGNRMHEYTDAVIGELVAAGVKYEFDWGSKHRMVTWQGANGRRRRFQIATTFGDKRALVRAKTDVRRILREDGNIKGKVDELSSVQ